MKRMMGILMSVGLVFAVAACDKKEAGTTTTETKPADTAAKPAEPADKPAEPAADKPAEPAATAGEVGVAECDEYIAKMTECAGKMSPESSGPMKESMETMKNAWKDASSTPEGKQALASGCKQALDAAKSAYASMGCTF
jgi:hypothetical protein